MRRLGNCKSAEEDDHADPVHQYGIAAYRSNACVAHFAEAHHDGDGGVVEDLDEVLLERGLVSAHGKGEVSREDDDGIVGSCLLGLLAELDGLLGGASSSSNEDGHIGVSRFIERLTSGLDARGPLSIRKVRGYRPVYGARNDGDTLREG